MSIARRYDRGARAAGRTAGGSLTRTEVAEISYTAFVSENQRMACTARTLHATAEHRHFLASSPRGCYTDLWGGKRG